MTDEVLRRARRELAMAPDDPALLKAYVLELERALALSPPSRPVAMPHESSIPCLLCERRVSMEGVNLPGATLADVVTSNFDDGAHCRIRRFVAVAGTSGNYGSRVIDMDGTLHFAICDGCLVRHSPKMIWEPKGTGPFENARAHFEEALGSSDDREIMAYLAKEP